MCRAACLLSCIALARGSLTFFTASDTHLGHDVGNITSLYLNTVTIGAINTLAKCGGVGANCTWPAEMGGGPVGAPRALIVSGDLIDNGADASGAMVAQWRNWSALYGLDGTDGLLQMPVYESKGNHVRPAAAAALRALLWPPSFQPRFSAAALCALSAGWRQLDRPDHAALHCQRDHRAQPAAQGGALL